MKKIFLAAAVIAAVMLSACDSNPGGSPPAATYSFTAPDPVTSTGVTATVTFNKPSPQAAGTSITATVTYTGHASHGSWLYQTNLTSVKAGLSQDPVKSISFSGAAPANKDYTFTMPAEDVDDFILTLGDQ
jgi:hypothetical protein